MDEVEFNPPKNLQCQFSIEIDERSHMISPSRPPLQLPRERKAEKVEPI
jgi:hypothetical protein